MDLKQVQTGIYETVPLHGRFLYFQLKHDVTADGLSQCLQSISDDIDGQSAVIGFGDAVLNLLQAKGLESLRFPSYETRGVQVPATPAALLLWLRGDDHGDVTIKGQSLIAKLRSVFDFESAVNVFRYKDGHDLTGYEDGTENPEGEEAFETAFSKSPKGGSYLAIQKWQHDLVSFKAKSKIEQDHTIGRELESNEELDDAPESAHVKRTEQEAFEPDTYLLRRSMPYSEDDHAGLMFLAFAGTTESFSKILAKMVGEEDGIVDALFSFSRPLTGAFFWCPPMKDGKMDLTVI